MLFKGIFFVYVSVFYNLYIEGIFCLFGKLNNLKFKILLIFCIFVFEIIKNGIILYKGMLCKC